MKNRNADNVLRGQFSAQDIVDAFKNGDYSQLFEVVGEKLQNPFQNIPSYGQSLDIRRVVEASEGTTNDLLLRFQPPTGMEAIITGYGIFSDAQFAAQTEFIPTLNGRRVFPFHGTPTDISNPRKLPYKISLGLGPDLSNENLIECNLRIQENDILEWRITNSSAIAQVMGVRFNGYLRSMAKAINYKIGG